METRNTCHQARGNYKRFALSTVYSLDREPQESGLWVASTTCFSADNHCDLTVDGQQSATWAPLPPHAYWSRVCRLDTLTMPKSAVEWGGCFRKLETRTETPPNRMHLHSPPVVNITRPNASHHSAMSCSRSRSLDGAIECISSAIIVASRSPCTKQSVTRCRCMSDNGLPLQVFPSLLQKKTHRQQILELPPNQ